MKKSRLAEGFRAYIRALLDAGMTQSEVAGKFDLSVSGLQGWIGPKKPTEPRLRELEVVAKLKKVSVPEAAAELLGQTYAPPSDRTWAQIGENMSLEEFRDLNLSATQSEIFARVRVLLELGEDRAASDNT